MKNLAKTARPLHDLLKDKVDDKQFAKYWKQDNEVAFQKIENIWEKEITLQHPDFTKPFTIHTDGSVEGG